MQTIEAIYEEGILRPLHTLEGIADRSRVTLKIESVVHPQGFLAGCVGTLPDEDAEEMRRAIEAEFERVNPHEW